MTRIAVASRSFSSHPELRRILLHAYSDVVFNETGRTLQGEELIQFLKDYDRAIIGLERLDANTLEQLPNLKVISRFGVGIDMLDLSVMKRKGIKLAYAVGANRRAVSELVIAFALNMLRFLPSVNDEARHARWTPKKGRQLSGKQVGIIGFGAIGKDLATILKTFDCEILIYDKVDHSEYCKSNQYFQVALDDLLQKSDIISLHLPLNPSTQMILNAERLNQIKLNAILINTARGGLVDEMMLKVLLKNNRFSAAFDVFTTEPLLDQELLTLPNFFGTPHIAGSTEEAILAMGHAAISGLENAIPVIRS